MWNNVLRKTNCMRFGKAGAHPQLAFGIAIAPETLSLITTFWFQRQLRFFYFLLDFYYSFRYSFICSANVGYSPTPRQHFWKIAGSKNFLVCAVFHVKHCSWETVCVWFGKIALLFAFVLFAGGCVVRIGYECFLDCSLFEVFCFQDGEQHLLTSLRLQ